MPYRGAPSWEGSSHRLRPLSLSLAPGPGPILVLLPSPSASCSLHDKSMNQEAGWLLG